MKKGFSLIEMLIATLVLSIGILAVLEVFPMGLRNVMKMQKYNKAVMLAEKKLEDLRSLSFNDPLLDPGTYTDTQDEYTITWTIQDNIPMQFSKYIVVTVSWTLWGQPYNVQLETFLTRF